METDMGADFGGEAPLLELITVYYIYGNEYNDASYDHPLQSFI